MLEQLIESASPRSQGIGQAALSMAIHAGIVCGAVTFTHGAAASRPPIPVDTTIIWTDPSPSTPRKPISMPVRIPGVPIPVASRVDPSNSLPLVIPAPIYSPIDPRSVVGHDTASTHGVETLTRVGHGPDIIGDVYLRAEVDEAPEPVMGARCSGDYPSALRSAGIEGKVLLQFIVNPDGRVDEGSVRVIESRMPAFAEAAAEGLRRASCQFKPGRSRGLAVRVLVQQTIAFRLDR